jgi:hypothetical protein
MGRFPPASLIIIYHKRLEDSMRNGIPSGIGKEELRIGEF